MALAAGTKLGPYEIQHVRWQTFLINSLPPNGGGPLSVISNWTASASAH